MGQCASYPYVVRHEDPQRGVHQHRHLPADHLGCYGYSAGTTPNVDALAREGVRFTSVITPYPMTLPAHASMLTGTYPKTHGVRWNSDRLGEANRTLASDLRAAGYQTAGFVGGFPLSRKFGLGQGFETYDDRFPNAGPGRIPNARRTR